MTNLTITGDLAKRLLNAAQQENLPVDQLLQAMLDDRFVHNQQSSKADEIDRIDEFIGAFDDDITDMSSTVRETLDAYYRKKYAESD